MYSGLVAAENINGCRLFQVPDVPRRSAHRQHEHILDRTKVAKSGKKSYMFFRPFVGEKGDNQNDILIQNL